MGDLSKSFQQTKAPLMLTNGSSAPGAASAYARAISNPHTQQASQLRTMGTSIFGGRLTQMTSGYKTQAELERERDEKKKEAEFRPVPTEWKVEQMEKKLNANHDSYIKQLEQIREQELKAK